MKDALCGEDLKGFTRSFAMLLFLHTYVCMIFMKSECGEVLSVEN